MDCRPAKKNERVVADVLPRGHERYGWKGQSCGLQPVSGVDAEERKKLGERASGGINQESPDDGHNDWCGKPREHENGPEEGASRKLATHQQGEEYGQGRLQRNGEQNKLAAPCKVYQ